MLILILHKINDLWARVRVGVRVRIIRVRDRVVPLVPVWPESLINITSNVLPVQAALEEAPCVSHEALTGLRAHQTRKCRDLTICVL